jgi:hypothetical protein
VINLVLDRRQRIRREIGVLDRGQSRHNLNSRQVRCLADTVDRNQAAGADVVRPVPVEGPEACVEAIEAAAQVEQHHAAFGNAPSVERRRRGNGKAPRH